MLLTAVADRVRFTGDALKRFARRFPRHDMAEVFDRSRSLTTREQRRVLGWPTVRAYFDAESGAAFLCDPCPQGTGDFICTTVVKPRGSL